MRVAALGDHFVLPSLFTHAIRAEPGAEDLEIDEHELQWPIEPFGPVAEVEEASGTEDDVIAALDGGADVLVTQMAPVTERVLESAPDLRLVVVSRGGPVNVNVDAASARGVAVCSAPGRNAAATAEFTVGLALAALRGVLPAHQELGSGSWPGEYYTYDRAGREVEGAPVGLVGFGAVGSRVARALGAMGAEVLVHDPYADAGELEAAGASAVELDDLLARSAVISLHARVTDETRGMIDAAALSRMTTGAVLVNCARGALVDEAAVADALGSGQLGAAALDVFADEPLAADSPLREAPNLVHTPHIAGATRQVAEKAARIAAAEVGRHARGEPYANPAGDVTAPGDRPT